MRHLVEGLTMTPPGSRSPGWGNWLKLLCDEGLGAHGRLEAQGQETCLEAVFANPVHCDLDSGEADEIGGTTKSP